MSELVSQSRAAKWGLWFWIAVMIAGHALVLNEPFVNQEFAFHEGARGLAEAGHEEGLVRYWAHQANPLGYSAATALVRKLMHLPADFWTSRLASLAGGALILVSGYFWFKKTRSVPADRFWLWGGAITLCPLVWIYTGRGTADVLPVGLLCLAFTTCWLAEGRWARHLLAAALLALSTLVKFNSLLNGLGFVVLALYSAGQCQLPLRTRLGQAALYGIIPALFLGGYFAWVYQAFELVLMQGQYREKHNPLAYAAQFPAIFAAYASYLVMLSGLLAILPVLAVWQKLGGRDRILLGGLSVLIATCAVAGLSGFDVGEMRFGGFDHILPDFMFLAIRAGFLALAGAFFFELTRSAFADKNEFCRFAVWALLPTLIVSSCARPAQRYLLFALPWMFFYLIVLAPPRLSRPTRYLGWASVIIFAGLSLVGSVYSVAQGRAAEGMARWIADQGLAGETDPGELRHHCEHYFPLNPNAAPNYTVSVAPGEDVIHSEVFTLFGRPLRGFYLHALKHGASHGMSRQE